MGNDGGMFTGSCLCGGVAFQTKARPTPPTACHCSQCRKQSGHYWAATHIDEDALILTASDTLRWYRASNRARRGFCARCGSFLFWQRDGADHFAVAMGAFDTPTGQALAGHIFVADKGDYYDITDGLPQRPQ